MKGETNIEIEVIKDGPYLVRNLDRLIWKRFFSFLSFAWEPPGVRVSKKRLLEEPLFLHPFLDEVCFLPGFGLYVYTYMPGFPRIQSAPNKSYEGPKIFILFPISNSGLICLTYA